MANAALVASKLRPQKRKLKRFPFRRTDAGNAELFASLCKNRLRYDHRRKSWLVWREHWWSEDVDGEVYRLVTQVARFRWAIAANISNEEERKKEGRWAIDSESRPRLEAALALARSVHPLSDDGANWDSDPWLLGVANGVLNLHTGRLRKGRPSDRITMHTDIAFDPSAQCPRWEQFLSEVFGDDTELIAFIQRAVGYSLTGDTSEQCLFACHGGGANGKSTFFETLRKVFGDYARNTPFSTLERNARTSISNDVAALVGRRFVTAVETNESVQFNEARVKALTGSDAMTARFLYGEYFTFFPVAKFWLGFNHKPVVADDSYGFWRRIRLIPFPKEFKGDADDKQLLPKLKAEAPGILAWAVRGCLAWQKDGLGMPKVVKESTEAYREESDPLSEFISDRCVVHEDEQVEGGLLWYEYQSWCTENQEPELDRKAFSKRLEDRGLKKIKVGHNRTRSWQGLSLESEATADADVRTDADG